MNAFSKIALHAVFVVQEFTRVKIFDPYVRYLS